MVGARWKAGELTAPRSGPRSSAGRDLCFQVHGFLLSTLVMDETTAQGRVPADVARDVLAAVAKKKEDVVLASLAPSLAIYLRTLAPALFFRLMASRARKEQKPKDS